MLPTKVLNFALLIMVVSLLWGLTVLPLPKRRFRLPYCTTKAVRKTDSESISRFARMVLPDICCTCKNLPFRIEKRHRRFSDCLKTYRTQKASVACIVGCVAQATHAVSNPPKGSLKKPKPFGVSTKRFFLGNLLLTSLKSAAFRLPSLPSHRIKNRRIKNDAQSIFSLCNPTHPLPY